MTTPAPTGRTRAVAVAGARFVGRTVQARLGGAERARVILVLACVLGLSGADVATVGASSTQLRAAFHISNTQIGLLIAVSSLVGAVATLPFGVLADRVRRTWTLGGAIVLWGVAMIWSAAISSFDDLLLTRLLLGSVTAAAGPMVASLVGDYFPADERGRIWGFILAGELVGTGFGFAVTGDVATLSWRAAFVVLAIPALVLAGLVFKLPEPARGGTDVLHDPARAGAVEPTDAQQLARDHGVEPDHTLTVDPTRRMHLLKATRYVLAVRTNVVLIAASACGYFFLAGVQTFGLEFSQGQYRIDHVRANGLLLVIGIGAIVGVLVGGWAGDFLVRRRLLNGRIVVSVISAAGATVLFAPAFFTRSATSAVPYLLLAALALSAQNPPLDAARLDIMPPQLWGRAEAIRTLLRSLAMALAPLLFGAVSDYVFGGGWQGLRWTFVVMLVPLGVSAALLFKGLGTYPRDVATAAASAERGREREERKR